MRYMLNYVIFREPKGMQSGNHIAQNERIVIAERQHLALCAAFLAPFDGKPFRTLAQIAE